MNILVLCTGNSARSILLEHILNADRRITAYSAGGQPVGRVHPQSLKLLASLGYDTSAARSKSWDEFADAEAPTMDAVITVCGSAAAETCPIWPGAPVRSHWGVEDPAAALPVDWDAAFQAADDQLHRKEQSFLDGSIDMMDAATLQAHLDLAGQQ